MWWEVGSFGGVVVWWRLGGGLCHLATGTSGRSRSSIE